MSTADPARSRLAAGISCIVVLIIVLARVVSSPDESPTSESASQPVARVEQGTFNLTVLGAAVFDAKQSLTVSSDLPSNKAKVVWLVPEGEIVSKGDVVAKFDPAHFNDEITKYNNDLKDARAQLSQANADLYLKNQDGELRKQKLENQLEIEETALNNFVLAELPVKLARAEKDLASAQSAYDRAAGDLEYQKEMFDSGFTNRRELEDAQFRYDDKKAALELANRTSESLKKMTLPAEKRKAEMRVEDIHREIAGHAQSQQKLLEKQNATIARLEARIAGLENQLRRAQIYLEKTVIKADVSGIVLYKKISAGTEKRKPQIGDSLWNRHGFAVIPDMSQFVAFMEIPESEIGRIAMNQSVTLRPEAYPNLSVSGHIDSIGALASSDAVEQAENRFRVRVELDSVDPRLRPGMTAQATINAGTYDNVARIPAQAIFYDGNSPVCFIYRHGRLPLKRAIKTGDSDGRYVMINAGLEPGDQVLLSFPAEFDS